ncbi:MAG: response regulator transcription factor, partial [Firmicutes bacterium]|nr:response regulator transcription factor [Bacillota bacterium]
MRLFVIDDHPLVQQGVEAIIGTQEDMEVVGMA